MTYQPAEETIAALMPAIQSDLRYILVEETGDDSYSDWNFRNESRALVINLMRMPAFQQLVADVWDEGYRTCDQVWVETADLVTPDEDRTSNRNPYRQEDQR